MPLVGRRRAHAWGRSQARRRGNAAPSTCEWGHPYIPDGENRRVGKSVNGTLVEGLLYQDGLHAVAQLDGHGNLVARFVFGSKPNVPDYFTNASGTFRILSDHLGSPRLVVNVSTGAVAEQIDYDEFGRVTGDTSPGLTPYGFAGGLYEPQTGLVRFGARDYDAQTGRWTSKDPLRFGGGSSNLYGYVLNDPVDGVDPNGTDSLACAIAEANAALICFAAQTEPWLVGACLAAEAEAVLICGGSPPTCQPPGPTPQPYCGNVGSGGCNKSKLKKRCTYKCDTGEQCDLNIDCGPGNWDPPCPSQAWCQ